MQRSPNIFKSNQKVSISITKNKKLLNQFYALREDCFKKGRGWLNFDGNESDFDRDSHIVVARTQPDSQVIGGVRIMFENQKLNFANETPNSRYVYRKYLEEFKNETVPKNSIVEISSMVILHDYRNGITFKNMVIYSLDFISKNKEAQYIVCIAPMASCRLYKIIANNIGYNVYIDQENPWINEINSYPIESYLIYMKLRN